MANEKRLIDANAMKEKLQAHHDFFVNAWGGFRNLPPKDKARVDEITHCIVEICNAPTVDAVEVVHGRWELHGNDDNWGCSYFCSNCHNSYDEDLFYMSGHCGHWNYCPNCGAKMDGDGNA